MKLSWSAFCMGSLMFMMTSSSGSFFRVTGLLFGKFTDHRWIPSAKDQWCGALMFSLICALNKRLSKQWWGSWFQTPSRRLLRHRNVAWVFLWTWHKHLSIPSSQEYMTWWRHQMETFSASLALCGGNPPVTGGFPSERPVMRSFDVFFDLHLNKQMSKQKDAGNLRRHHVHYDVTVVDPGILGHVFLISHNHDFASWRELYNTSVIR